MGREKKRVIHKKERIIEEIITFLKMVLKKRREKKENRYENPKFFGILDVEHSQ